MSTEKQIAANRLNAMKSTGPRTERGKRIAAANSRRDWNLADTVLITNESRKHFIGYLHSYIDHYKPQTPHERDLVETMAVARWRTIRLWAFESSNMITAIHNLLPTNEVRNPCDKALRALQQNETGNRTQELLSRYEARYDRQYHRAAKALERALEHRDHTENEHRDRNEKSQEHDEPNHPQQNQ